MAQFEKRNAAHTEEKNRDRQRTGNREPHPSGERRDGGEENAPPEQDFAEVVRIPRELPKARFDPFSSIRRVVPERKLLCIGDRFDSQPGEENAQTRGFHNADGGRTIRCGKNRDGEKENPDGGSLESPKSGESNDVLPAAVKPFVLFDFQNAGQEVGCKPQTPEDHSGVQQCVTQSQTAPGKKEQRDENEGDSVCEIGELVGLKKGGKSKEAGLRAEDYHEGGGKRVRIPGEEG